MHTAQTAKDNRFIKTNETLFIEGRKLQSVGIIRQGKVNVHISACEDCSSMDEEKVKNKSYKILSMPQNTFLGINDLFHSDTFSFSFTACEDTHFTALPIQNPGQLTHLLNSGKDYAPQIINSLSLLLSGSYTVLSKMEKLAGLLEKITANLIIFFWNLKEIYGLSGAPSGKAFKEGLNNLRILKENNIHIPGSFRIDFIEKDNLPLYEEDLTIKNGINESKIDYFEHLSELCPEIHKAFFCADPRIVFHHCEEASEILDRIQSGLKCAFGTAEECLTILFAKEGESIFTEYIKAAVELGNTRQDASPALHALEYTVAKLGEIAAIYEKEYNFIIHADITYLKTFLNRVNNTVKNSLSENTSFMEAAVEVSEKSGEIPPELRDSTLKILEFSGLSRDRAGMFLTNLEAFKRQDDRFSQDTEVRSIRNTLTTLFFEIYEAVMRKVLAAKNASTLCKMFLLYGYMDENLLTPNQVRALYTLAGRSSTQAPVSVYNMLDWLTGIYNKKKDPSINEFGQDYFDVFREMRKQGAVSEKQRLEYEGNAAGRLKFEIDNMLRINQKLCYGQISAYIPILHSGMITRNIEHSLITPEMVQKTVRKILDIDFSAFHREVSYRQQEGGIEKEFIMKSVLPDILLVPTFGSRASMWQEIAGRNRSTPGRFIFPIFTGENLNDLMVKMIGIFRWELCRTMMGISWNDVSQKSLTSEYNDYIQFYKRNKELHEDVKERIKNQIQKHRSMMRDIFASDYELWTNYESKGVLRLNRISRAILYRYCPFSKPIRMQLEKQPAFSDAAAQFNILRAKKAREIENRYNKFVKAGFSIDEELAENLKFYKEL